MYTPAVADNKMDNTIATTTGLSYGAGLAGLLGGVSLNDWLALGGFIFMVLTYFTNFYFRQKDERRKAELHEWKRKNVVSVFIKDEDSE